MAFDRTSRRHGVSLPLPAMLGVALLAGCSRMPAAPGIAALAQGGRQAAVAGDPQRLATDLRRAVREMGWGLQRLDVVDPDRPVLHAECRLLDERVAWITASAPPPGEGDGEIQITVRVGVAGDEKLEREFERQLRATLAGPAARQRGGKFELPEAPKFRGAEQ